MFYAELQKALKCVIHHRPSGADDEETEKRVLRLDKTQRLYNKFFGNQPIGARVVNETKIIKNDQEKSNEKVTCNKNRYTLHVKTLDGKECTIFPRDGPTSLIQEVKHIIDNAVAIPPNEQRLVFDGTQLLDEWTLQDYNIGSESTVHVVTVLRGC
ncbi:MAG: hypothetical protein EOP45_13690 [Sphingobacteriaceae bacterium]|nr:MAG: hypothetical protein EOP45_13690 [Sphingobacteriaceae bacterium]